MHAVREAPPSVEPVQTPAQLWATPGPAIVRSERRIPAATTGKSGVELDLRRMRLDALVQAIREEAHRYRAGASCSGTFAMELVRRAVCDGNDAAWAALVDQYRGLVLSWVRHHPASAAVQEEDDYWVNRAFARFWMALRPERFRDFPRLGAVLCFLRTCAHSALMDEVRAHEGLAPAQELVVGDEHTDDAQWLTAAGLAPDPGAVAEEHETRAELWDVVDRVLPDECLRVVIYLSYARDMTPRAIQAQLPHLFSSACEVSQVKRNALARLANSPELRKLLERRGAFGAPIDDR